MPSAQEAREARRRRILARGSDRLAFIAGERPSISAASLASSSVAEIAAGSDIASTPVARSGEAALIRLVDTCSPEFATADCDPGDRARVIEDRVEEDKRIVQDFGDFLSFEEGSNADDGASPKTSNNANLTSVDRKLDERGPSSTKGRWSAPSSITWDGIANSIDATENFRALGAVLLAVIAMVHCSFGCTKLEGKFLRDWVLPWPVALVILTDISLVFGALLLGLVRIPPFIKPVDVRKGSDAQDQLSKVSEISSLLESRLKVGSVVFKTFRALFLDCSIYAVTLISGYSLGQNWQSVCLN